MSAAIHPQTAAAEAFWHVTVLSNFARGYDKYSRRYSKSSIPESTFPERFFLLREEELAAGARKAGGLLRKLGIPGDRLVALRAEVDAGELRENTRTGIGQYVERGWITLSGVAWMGEEGEGSPLEPAVIEEVMAESLRLLHGSLHAFESLRPRSFSVLPVARGCQASCPFCFSDASASAEQDQARLNLARVAEHAQQAAERGAGRFVITGGGEPGLLRHEVMRELIAVGRPLGKTVLITNGHHLARRDGAVRSAMLEDYARSGLGVLAVSRHHHDDGVSTKLMSLE
ncbi:MAG: radical SAM protein, partial [Verrucomicrobiaceae bacterium]